MVIIRFLIGRILIAINSYMVGIQIFNIATSWKNLAQSVLQARSFSIILAQTGQSCTSCTSCDFLMKFFLHVSCTSSKTYARYVQENGHFPCVYKNLAWTMQVLQTRSVHKIFKILQAGSSWVVTRGTPLCPFLFHMCEAILVTSFKQFCI